MQGLIAALRLDGQGGGVDLSATEAERPLAAVAPAGAAPGVEWIHMDYTDPGTVAWLRERSGVDPVVADALVAEETRPRSAPLGDGLLVVLRGVNLNPGAEPDDMVSLRIWSDGRRVLSLRKRRLLSVDDVRGAIAAGTGPRDAAELVTSIADRLLVRMEEVLQSLEERVDDLEEAALGEGAARLRVELGRVRRQIITLRRYLAPQREALARLAGERAPWLEDRQRVRLRELADRLTRYVEDLDSARDRAAIVQEELANRLSEQLNLRMYVLSLVAGVFLPLSFITGLLGINVGGIPLAESPAGFLAVLILLGGLTLLEIVLFRWRRWL